MICEGIEREESEFWDDVLSRQPGYSNDFSPFLNMAGVFIGRHSTGVPFGPVFLYECCSLINTATQKQNLWDMAKRSERTRISLFHIVLGRQAAEIKCSGISGMRKEG